MDSGEGRDGYDVVVCSEVMRRGLRLLSGATTATRHAVAPGCLDSGRCSAHLGVMAASACRSPAGDRRRAWRPALVGRGEKACERDAGWRV